MAKDTLKTGDVVICIAQEWTDENLYVIFDHKYVVVGDERDNGLTPVLDSANEVWAYPSDWFRRI